MLTDADLERIRTGLAGTDTPVELIFRPAEHDGALASALLETARRVERASRGTVVLGRDDGAVMVARPALTIACRGRANLHYLAVPAVREGPPFVEALIGVARLDSAPRAEWTSALTALEKPATLHVFVTSTCPHCPGAVRSSIRLSLANSRISTSIIDALAYPDLAKRFRAQSVPLTVLDGGLSWTGVVPASDLARAVLSRGTEEHDAAVFASLVEHGRLGEAAARIRTGPGAASFVSAWRASTTSARMALLLVVADVLASGSNALEPAVAELVKLLGSDDVSLRGDTADLLGQIGHPAAADGLRALLDDPNPDVVEISEEALEAIGDGGGDATST
jgi:hypothetical protein